MSFEALSWASRQECGNSLNKLILLMLANYSDENHQTYPSYKHLAKICHCADRTAMRAVKELAAKGFLEIQPRFTTDGKQTSNIFILSVRGDRDDRVGVTQTTPNTVRDIQVENTGGGDINDTPTAIRINRNGYPENFEHWWTAYPRSDGSKRKAFETWQRVVGREIEAEELFLKTCDYSRTTHGKDKKFIPHAVTWLNQRRWETVEEAQQVTTNRNSLAG